MVYRSYSGCKETNNFAVMGIQKQTPSLVE